jgi:hypothetical protein
MRDHGSGILDKIAFLSPAAILVSGLRQALFSSRGRVTAMIERSSALTRVVIVTRTLEYAWMAS